MLGLCGGYQMLGKRLSDPHGIEGAPRTVDGLGLLDIETEFGRDKALSIVEGTLENSNAHFTGYEMHVGRTSGPDTARPFLRFADGRSDGAKSADGHVAGCYVHGLFGSDAARTALLQNYGAATSNANYELMIDATLDQLAEHLAKHIDTDALLTLAR